MEKLVFKNKLMSDKKIYNNISNTKLIGKREINIFDANYTNGILNVGNQKLFLPEIWVNRVVNSGCSEICFGIKPEHIKLSKVPLENAFNGAINHIECYDNKFSIHFLVESNEIIAIVDENEFRPNDLVYFSPDFTKIHLFYRNTVMSSGYPKEIY